MTSAPPAAHTEPARLTTQPARFHLSLNVRDLDRTVEFLRAFFGCEPAKCRPDYAKFELADPPLVLSLEPCRVEAGGNLNHLGFRVNGSAALVEVQRRLELAGIATRREEGVECCYARQTKFWVHDPDGNLWEIYTLDEDIDHRGDGRLPVIDAPAETSTAARDDAPPPAAIWTHRLGQPFPARLPILDETVDEVHLQGTLNERLDAAESARRLAETRRILRPEGIVRLHLLTADRDLGAAALALPGPAAAVRGVPVDTAVLAALTTAGFRDAKFSFRAASPCFRVGEAELRETRLEARK